MRLSLLLPMFAVVVAVTRGEGEAHASAQATPTQEEEVQTFSEKQYYKAINVMRKSCLQQFLKQKNIDYDGLDQTDGITSTLIGDEDVFKHNMALYNHVDKIRNGKGMFTYKYNEFVQRSFLPVTPKEERALRLAQREATAKREELLEAKEDLKKEYRASKKSKEMSFDEYAEKDTLYQSIMHQWLRASENTSAVLSKVYGPNFSLLQQGRQDTFLAVKTSNAYLSNVNMAVAKHSLTAEYALPGSAVYSEKATFDFAPAWIAQGARATVKRWKASNESLDPATCYRYFDSNLTQSETAHADAKIVSHGFLSKRTTRINETYSRHYVKGKNMRIDINWAGLKVIPVEMGQYFLPNWGQVATIDKRDENVDDPDQIKLNELVEEYFGANGPLRSRVKYIVLGYRPTFRFTMENADMTELKDVLERSGRTCFIFCGSKKSSANRNDYVAKVLENGIEFTDASNTPLLVGLIWDTYGDGK